MCDCTEDATSQDTEGGKKPKAMSHPTLSYIKRKQIVNGKIITSYKPAPIPVNEN